MNEILHFHYLLLTQAEVLELDDINFATVKMANFSNEDTLQPERINVFLEQLSRNILATKQSLLCLHNYPLLILSEWSRKFKSEVMHETQFNVPPK